MSAPAPSPWLAEPEDPMERMTEAQWRAFRGWAWAVLVALAVVLGIVLWGARG